MVPVAAGAVFWSGLYLVTRTFLARVIFDPLLKKCASSSPLVARTEFTSKKSDNDYAVESNPPPSPKNRLSDAEVVELSSRSVEV